MCILIQFLLYNIYLYIVYILTFEIQNVNYFRTSNLHNYKNMENLLIFYI